MSLQASPLVGHADTPEEAREGDAGEAGEAQDDGAMARAMAAATRGDDDDDDRYGEQQETLGEEATPACLTAVWRAEVERYAARRQGGRRGGAGPPMACVCDRRFWATLRSATQAAGGSTQHESWPGEGARAELAQYERAIMEGSTSGGGEVEGGGRGMQAHAVKLLRNERTTAGGSAKPISRHEQMVHRVVREAAKEAQEEDTRCEMAALGEGAWRCTGCSRVWARAARCGTFWCKEKKTLDKERRGSGLGKGSGGRGGVRPHGAGGGR